MPTWHGEVNESLEFESMCLLLPLNLRIHTNDKIIKITEVNRIDVNNKNFDSFSSKVSKENLAPGENYLDRHKRLKTSKK